MEVSEKESANRLGHFKQIHLKDGYSIRPATSADYQAIVDIDADRKFNDGFDYLPYVLHHHLSQENRYCGVLEKDGKVVGYLSHQLVDGGCSIMGQSGRGILIHRGKKVLMLQKRIYVDMILEAHPDVKFEYSSQLNSAFFMKRHKEGNTYSQLMMCRPQIPLTVDVSQMTLLTSRKYTHGDTIMLTREAALLSLEDMDNQIRLFPHGYIYVGWEPYKLIRTNFKYLPACEFYATSTQNGGYTYASMSFGTPFLLQRGLFYILDYYGHNLLDATAHVQRHLSEAIWRHYKHGEIYIMVHVPATMDYFHLVEHLDTEFKGLGITVTKYGQIRRRHFSRLDFERDHTRINSKY